MLKTFRFWVYIVLTSAAIFSCKKDEVAPVHDADIEYFFINGQYLANGKTIYNIPVDSVIVQIDFSVPINTKKLDPNKFYITNSIDTAFAFLPAENNKQMVFKIRKTLDYFTTYKLAIAKGEHLGVNLTGDYVYTFVTRLDTTPKFPRISDDSLLSLVQKRTFGYFWDHAHPVSGLIRDRKGGGETVTSGGSGFGVMAILVGINRGFITREQGFERLNTIVNFLNKPATDKFHGAFPHWLDGTTGKTIPFTQYDNGGDLIETAFLMEGLLTVREFFKNGSTPEKQLCDTITKLWENVEWNWYQNNQKVLYWHWSPNYNWKMNMPILGWNEGLISYILAASSNTYPIAADVYHQGWARNGASPMKNGKSFYNITLPLGEDYGGPLFFAHYSFLGLDPRNLADKYANYWEQNRAHSLINYNYCVKNTKRYPEYGAHCWGLTACDVPNGYNACSPLNDMGVIAPTAALSSMPYTPEESLAAMRFYYYVLGDKLWGEYGFYDSFSLKDRWFATSYLAIDQGPIICMIENYRSGLLWNLFMQNDEIKQGLTRLGFTY